MRSLRTLDLHDPCTRSATISGAGRCASSTACGRCRSFDRAERVSRLPFRCGSRRQGAVSATRSPGTDGRRSLKTRQTAVSSLFPESNGAGGPHLVTPPGHRVGRSGTRRDCPERRLRPALSRGGAARGRHLGGQPAVLKNDGNDGNDGSQAAASSDRLRVALADREAMAWEGSPPIAATSARGPPRRGGRSRPLHGAPRSHESRGAKRESRPTSSL